MPVDEGMYNRAATRGDVAGVAIRASIALDRIVDALRMIGSGDDADSEIAAITSAAKELEEAFDTLTGWKPDDVG